MLQSVVKIAVSSEVNYTHIDDVVYYRSGMSPDFLTRWLWYFEYLAARVKVANPYRRVALFYGPVDIKLGQEWHEHRRQSLLKSRSIKLTKLSQTLPQSDLFDFGKSDHEKNLNALRQQIKSLELDMYPIPEFPEYINKLKSYLYGFSS